MVSQSVSHLFILLVVGKLNQNPADTGYKARYNLDKLYSKAGLTQRQPLTLIFTTMGNMEKAVDLICISGNLHRQGKHGNCIQEGTLSRPVNQIQDLFVLALLSHDKHATSKTKISFAHHKISLDKITVQTVSRCTFTLQTRLLYLYMLYWKQ